jgi:hypothetical protein
MRFTLLTLLGFMTLVAIAIATICRPNETVTSSLRTAVILSGCTSLIVGFFSTGRTQRFALTYGTFSLVLLSLAACPSTLAEWVAETVPPPPPAPPDPFTAIKGGGGGFSGFSGFATRGIVIRLTQHWFAVFVAIIAGGIAAGFRPSEKAQTN